jgi:hypothetical protein
VVAFDLSEEYDGDLVPFPQHRDRPPEAARRGFVRRLNNGWWLVHRAAGLKARMVYGSVYDIPTGIGSVDVATFGCILLHLRDPYRALESAARLVRHTIVVTEHPVHWDRFPGPPTAEPLPAPPSGTRGRLLRLVHRALGDGGWWQREDRLRGRVEAAEASTKALHQAPLTLFLPDARHPEQDQAWWCFRPEAIQAMLGTLGFTRSRFSSTEGPLLDGRPQRLFTVVASRA